MSILWTRWWLAYRTSILQMWPFCRRDDIFWTCWGLDCMFCGRDDTCTDLLWTRNVFIFTDGLNTCTLRMGQYFTNPHVLKYYNLECVNMCTIDLSSYCQETKPAISERSYQTFMCTVYITVQPVCKILNQLQSSSPQISSCLQSKCKSFGYP